MYNLIYFINDYFFYQKIIKSNLLIQSLKIVSNIYLEFCQQKIIKIKLNNYFISYLKFIFQ